jgi:Gnt-I system high-affinity gluconate transporter
VLALASVLLAVTLLIVLIAWGKVQPFLAFVVAALAAALLLGLPLEEIPQTIERGIGDLLGTLSIVICFGAMFGKRIADSGAAQRIAKTLMGVFGRRFLPLAMTLTGFIVGIPLFYNVGFVLLVPLVFSVVYQSRLPAVFLGIPLLAGLSIAHGFLPPHPSPAALVTQFGADMGRTLFYGFLVGVPTLLIAGPLFALRLRHLETPAPDWFVPTEQRPENLPGAWNSFLSALLPVLLIAVTTGLAALFGPETPWQPVLAFAGHPVMVMLLALAVATFSLGLAQGRALKPLMEGYGAALRDVAPILLIVAGAGALKQVFVDGGLNAELGRMLQDLPIPPLVLGWLIATVIRICLGSATVAGLTAAGIVAPLLAATDVDPNLMVLAIGAGSLMCSHVNDSGFWMFKEYFNASLADTFRSWSLMETLVGLFGLLFVLLLDLWR